MVIMREEEEEQKGTHNHGYFTWSDPGKSSGIILQGSDEAEGEATI